VLWALLALTIITVIVGVKVDFGTRSANIVIGVLIAIVKASLVTAIFMHMKYEKRSWLVLVLFPILLVMIIIFSNFPDTAMNQDFTTPAVERIPHVGASKAGGAAH
jgi:cytochrome c oxidase subunit IV